MARRRTVVQLSDDLLEALSSEAQRRGLLRLALIRSVLQEYVHAQTESSIGGQIAEGHGRIRPATPDEWGDLPLHPARNG